MDETRKIIIIAFGSVMAALWAYSFGYINLTEYYIVFGGMIIPGVGGYTFWNLFLRRAFSIHFQSEDGNALREVGFIRILPFEKDKTLLSVKSNGVERQFYIDSRNAVWTDRRNKIHLFFPINNLFAFHPFAKTYSTIDVNGKTDIPDEFKRVLEPEEEIKIPEVLSDEEKKKWEATHKNPEAKDKRAITSIPIEFFTLMKVSAMEFAQLFSGKLIISRVESNRRPQGRPDKSFGFLLLIVGLLAGVVLGVFVLPLYIGHSTTGQTIQTSTTNDQTTTNTSTQSTTTLRTTTQTIPPNSTYIGGESNAFGNTTIQYSTYTHSNSTIIITKTTTH